MRTLAQFEERLHPYKDAQSFYDSQIGYIAWHYSTGDNIEVLYIEAAVSGLGLGGELYRRMVQQLLANGERPYHSIFGYRLKSNKVAEKFYRSMGWSQVDLGQSIYAGDETVIMWDTWDHLLNRLHLKENDET